MQFLKVKWENIFVLMLLATTLYSWYCYTQNINEVKMLFLACINSFALLVMLFDYSTLKSIRKVLIENWK